MPVGKVSQPPLDKTGKVCHRKGMKNKEQVKWWAVFTTHNTYKAFADYVKAWQFAEKVYQETGCIVAIEPIVEFVK